MKNRLLLLLLALLPALSFGQRSRTSKLADGTLINREETVVNTAYFDKLAPVVSDQAVFGRFGGRVANFYTLEDKKGLNVAQFGTGRYFSPNYRFGVDFNFNLTVAQRRARGETLFSTRSLLDGEFRTALNLGEGLNMAFESGLNGPYEGVGFYEASLATLESYWQGTIEGATYGYWIPNIETSNEWYPGNSGSPYPGFAYGTYGTAHSPSWESSQNKSITLESTGETITIGQLAARGPGAWEVEKNTRRSNRLVLIQVLARQRSPQGSYVGYGASMYQAEPRLSNAFNPDAFNDGTADVSKIGGDSQGNVTLNGRSYKLSGSVYQQEQVMLDYYYRFYYNLSESALQAVFINQTVTTYPEFWGLMDTRHVVGDQVGHWLANKYRMTALGQTDRGSICMREPMFEGALAVVNGQLRQESARVPPSFGTGCLDFNNGGSICDDYPKPWIPPYEMYSYYVVHRFLEGGKPGAGFYLFNAPAKFDPNTEPGYNQVYHSINSLFQARYDLQPYERFFDNSTLVTQPDVQINQSGNWESYNAVQAYNYDQGSFGPQKPVYCVRYQQTSTGWRVLVMGGMNLGHSEERTDLVRLPNGLLGGNMFRIKLRGPSAQVYEFSVSNTDSGQIYEATPTNPSNWYKAGYAGRIISSN